MRQYDNMSHRVIDAFYRGDLGVEIVDWDK